ncbi:hypothetical protein ACMA1D_25725 [Streptomyces sp. 796.1]|uniref:hypothetical protein n=1 Tax=Streptomyces sp. 796.1 TaxID=3163029 RepID=UPI0039C8D7FD
MSARSRTAPHAPRRGTAWCARLLLLSALLFGIVTMHTIGHPAEHGSAGGPGAASEPGVTAAHRAVDASGEPTAGAPGATAHHATAARPEPGDTLTRPAHPAPPRLGAQVADQIAAPGHGGMDPLSVCLAVLVAWTVVLVLSAAARRRTGAAAVRCLGAPGRPRRRGPPPLATAAARLPVLRI